MKKVATATRTTFTLKLSKEQLAFVLKHDPIKASGLKPSPTRAFKVMISKLGYKGPDRIVTAKKKKVSRD